jgi:GH25 family lysozyme M1 (1,4-beta-N-acetylmuramidase)
VLNKLASLLRIRPAATGLLPGVDVSSFSGLPSNWQKAAGTISWAAVKITELEPNGTRYVNPDAAADWKWLAENKKGRIGYLFGHPSVSASETVSFFISELTKLGLRDTDGVALDLEVTDGRGPAGVAAWANAVQSELHLQLHRHPVLYTFIDFAKQGNCAGLGRYPLWIADPSSPAGSPRVPEPWTTWAIHQYQFGSTIDRDVANYRTEAAMAEALGSIGKNLGGSLTGGLAVGRWADGTIVVLGLGTDGYVHANTLGQTGWHKVSPTTAKGTPAVTVWTEKGIARGRLYYIDAAGAAIQLITADHGKTWT